MIEAKKLAYADMLRYVADPRFGAVPVAAMLSKDRAKERAKLIDPARAACDVKPAALDGLTNSGGGDTIYLTAIDKDGNIVSLIQSLYSSFGSGVVPPGTGFMLHNRGALFTLQADHPNVLAPRKRPLHTIIPGFMEKGDVRIGFGIMGGFNQAQAHAQFVADIADYGLDIQQALDAGRFTKLSFTGCDVYVESMVPQATRSPPAGARARRRRHPAEDRQHGGLWPGRHERRRRRAFRCIGAPARRRGHPRGAARFPEAIKRRRGRGLSITMDLPARSEAVLMRPVRLSVLGLSVVCILSVRGPGSCPGKRGRVPVSRAARRGVDSRRLQPRRHRQRPLLLHRQPAHGQSGRFQFGDVRHRRRRRAHRANEHAVRFRDLAVHDAFGVSRLRRQQPPADHAVDRIPAAAADGKPQGVPVENGPVARPLRLGAGALRAVRRRRRRRDVLPLPAARRLHRLRDVQGVSRQFRVRRLDADRAHVRRHRRVAQSAIRRDGRRPLRVGAQAPQHRLRAVPADRSVRVLR